MKIAIAHYSSKKDISGVTTWLVALMNYFVNRGHNVFLHLHHFDKTLGVSNIMDDIIDIPINVTSSVRKNIGDDVSQILSWLNEVNPDCFLPQCLHANYISAYIAGKAGLPWLLTVHSDDPDYWYVCEKLNPYESNGTVIAVSKNLNVRLQSFFSNNSVRYIPYGVDLDSIKTTFDSANFNVIYIGRLEKQQKQVERVLDVFISTCSLSPHIKCYLIGDGSEKNNLINKINSSGLSNQIVLTGALKKNEIKEYLKKSHVFVLMSDYEGLPVALLEAMSFGVVPVVRKIESGIPELVHDSVTGFSVDNEIELVSHKILSLSTDETLWNELSANANTYINDNYNQFKFFEEYLDLIKEKATSTRCLFPIQNDFSLNKYNLDLRKLHNGYIQKINPVSLYYKKVLKIFYRYFVEK